MFASRVKVKKRDTATVDLIDDVLHFIERETTGLPQERWADFKNNIATALEKEFSIPR